MLRFSDKPYCFFPPRYFAPTAALIREANRLYLQRRLLIERLTVLGREHLRPLPANARLILLANHPTHCDASILLEACRQLDLRPRIMAAYDLYHRGQFDGWVLRRVGCFSVDREGSDKLALEEANRTILDGDGGSCHLAMFPEGNVYLENDRVTPLHDGAALLAVRAIRQLGDRPLYCVPISIKATHLTDCRQRVAEILRSLADEVGVSIAGTRSPLEALRAVGLAAARRELARRGIKVSTTDDLPTLVREAASEVLGRIEPELELKPGADDEPIDRVRAARRVIHEIRIDANRHVHEHARATAHAEEAMLAFRLASYSGNYVAERPTLDRIGETCEKLYEDLHDEFLPPYAPRAAIVRINEPIDVATLVTAQPKQKMAIAALTEAIERSVQAGIDEANAGNRLPGAEVWERM